MVKSAGGGTSQIWAPFNNAGTVEARTGTLQFGYAFVQTAGETILNGGNIAPFGSPLPPAPRFDGGRLRGSGTIGTGLNNPGGIVEPGFSTGEIAVNGTCTQGTGGTLRIEIGGLEPITEPTPCRCVDLNDTLIFGICWTSRTPSHASVASMNM